MQAGNVGSGPTGGASTTPKVVAETTARKWRCQCSGAVPRPGWEAAAGNGWYRLNELLRSLWRPMEQLYFSCVGGGSDSYLVPNQLLCSHCLYLLIDPDAGKG